VNVSPSGPGSDRRPVYAISVIAELSGVRPESLRAYEAKGLLDPHRTQGGTRRYSQRDLEQVARIAELLGEGLNIAGVRRVLALEADVERLGAEVERLSAEIARLSGSRTRREPHDGLRRPPSPAAGA
jgi:MerR family transcriptional regulator/heat shock protein HspR